MKLISPRLELHVSWGVIYRSVPGSEFEAAITVLVANLAGKGPAALARAKHLVCEGLRLPLPDGLALETETIIDHLGEKTLAARSNGSPSATGQQGSRCDAEADQ